MDNTKNAIINKQEQIKNIKNDNIELEQRIEQLKQKIEDIKNEVTDSSNKVEELKNNRSQKNDKLSKIEVEITSQFEIIEDLKAHIVKIEVRKTKLEQDLEDVINKMWEEYEMTPNNAVEYEKPSNVQDTIKNVADIRNKIKELGSINIDSIEEYKQTKQRYDFMCEQRLDLENSITKLKKVIQDKYYERTI